jgi:Cdc6-like AAA superfamily ATPase
MVVDGGQAYDEDDARVARVCHRVSAEIGHVMWREHISHDHVHEVHMPDNVH